MPQNNIQSPADEKSKVDLEIQEAIIKTFEACDFHEFTISDIYHFGLGMSRFSKRTSYGRNKVIPYQRVQAQIKRLGGFLTSTKGHYLIPLEGGQNGN